MSDADANTITKRSNRRHASAADGLVSAKDQETHSNAGDGGDDTIISPSPKIGERDKTGRTIREIYWATKKFVIYSCDPEAQIHYLLPEDYSTAEQLRRNIFCLTELRSDVE
jgi:hypothetical protein